ncbi:MAG: NrsF family protein, partial [Lysobacter sp.]
MNDTDTLIDQLAARAGPVKRLASPGRRTLLWIALAVAIVAIIVAVLGARPGWWQDLAVPSAAIEWVASVMTSVLAAYAVFQISVPGRSPSWAWLPLPSALLWLGGIGLGCLRDFGHLGTGAFTFQLGSAECAWTIALISLPIGLLLLLMVRHAGVVRPGVTAMLTGLSAAALSSAA